MLRHGVMLDFEKHSNSGMELRTIPDVLVEDGMRERCLTIASRGPSYGDRVFRLSARGRDISRIFIEVSHTDVALVKRNEDETDQSRNGSFGATSLRVPPTKLKELILPNEFQIGFTVYTNNPFAGYFEGTCRPHSNCAS
ncbi:hypothetical protein P168DRAFT_341498 [Aspergillus campestris IBT 28561]|uniref:Uncharacterized protein n=1 Tax=Aspergillus campestris (strain IBT 28561) TaxID=1392248 RepID=A0A2I1D7P3_ASPC2|nr:uncharacterized protein P168DRAFT_341498 [Aspergillus campestris IBT 28561]PKY05899.1 hypothetical protein P168DRAFT_341498 [Aspergillus campestris IBT 28561]